MNNRETPTYYTVSPPGATNSDKRQHAITVALLLQTILRPSPATYRRIAAAYTHIYLPGTHALIGKN